MAVDENEIDINPRPTVEVGRRLIVLASLLRRGFLEDAAAHDKLGDEVDDERFDLLAWLEENAIASDLEPGERDLLAAKVGSISDQEIDQVLFPIEGMIALSWYVGLRPDLPEFGNPNESLDPLKSIPSPWDDVKPWLHELNARSLEELARERELAEIWNWRAWTEEDLVMSTDRERQLLKSAIRETALEAVNAGLLPNHLSGDFPFQDKPFSALHAEVQEAIGLAAHQRLRALNWICGFGESWSSTPTDIE